MTAGTLPLFFLALAASAAAGAPKGALPGNYELLWTNSPFTSKPQDPGPVKETNPLENFALGGISPIRGGYRVTLLNRRNPQERIVLPENPGFKIVSVQYDTGNPLATTVRLSTGASVGTVSFDSNLLTLNAVPVRAPAAHAPTIPPTGGERAPRPRTAPPAPNAAAPGAP